MEIGEGQNLEQGIQSGLKVDGGVVEVSLVSGPSDGIDGVKVVSDDWLR